MLPRGAKPRRKAYLAEWFVRRLGTRALLWLDHVAANFLGTTFVLIAYLIVVGIGHLGDLIPETSFLDWVWLAAVRVVGGATFALTGVAIIVADALVAYYDVKKYVQEEIDARQP